MPDEWGKTAPLPERLVPRSHFWFLTVQIRPRGRQEAGDAGGKTVPGQHRSAHELAQEVLSTVPVELPADGAERRVPLVARRTLEPLSVGLERIEFLRPLRVGLRGHIRGLLQQPTDLPARKGAARHEETEPARDVPITGRCGHAPLPGKRADDDGESSSDSKNHRRHCRTGCTATSRRAWCRAWCRAFAA